MQCVKKNSNSNSWVELYFTTRPPTLLISLSLQPSDQRISLYLLFQLVFVFFNKKPLSCIWEKAFQICGHFVRAKKRSRVLRNLCMRVVWAHAWFRIWRFYRHQGRMFHTQVFVLCAWMCVQINFMPQVCTCEHYYFVVFLCFSRSQQDYLTTPRKLNVTCSRACGNLCPCLISDNCCSWTSRYTEVKPTHTFTLLFPISFPLWKLLSHKMKTRSHFPPNSTLDVSKHREKCLVSGFCGPFANQGPMVIKWKGKTWWKWSLFQPWL